MPALSTGLLLTAIFIALASITSAFPRVVEGRDALGSRTEWHAQGRAGLGAMSNDRDVADVRAALVFKILRYITWEGARFANDKAPLECGMVGSGPTVKALQKVLKGKRFGKRKIVLRHFKKPADVRDCHLLYVMAAASDALSLKTVFSKLPAQGVFVLGESPGLASKGCTFNFYIEKKEGSTNVCFEVNPDNAKRRAIKLHSDLLGLARIVRDDEELEAAR